MLGIERERHIEHVGHGLGPVIDLAGRSAGRAAVRRSSDQHWSLTGRLPFASRCAVAMRSGICANQSDRFTTICVMRTVGGIRIGHAQQRDAWF